MRLTGALRSVAVVEGAKGGMALALALTCVTLVHHDIPRAAARMVAGWHLSPDGRYASMFLRTATLLTDRHLWLIALGALLYAMVRFVEAYGLWWERRWAEWFAAVGAAIYLPFELYETLFHFNGLVLGALLVNTTIVVCMAAALWRGRRGIRGGAEPLAAAASAPAAIEAAGGAAETEA
jgi:uncharacterized membrane protein (DUF2068 family)